jgi:hypothetical protein
MVPPWRACVKHHEQRLSGAAPESNRPSRGLHDRTGFEDSASTAERSDLRLLRASVRASWERDDLGDVALEIRQVAWRRRRVGRGVEAGNDPTLFCAWPM